MKKHVHADVIHAWADGQAIQQYLPQNDKWVDVTWTPEFSTDVEYRIKPAEPEQVYPMVLWSDEEASDVYYGCQAQNFPSYADDMRYVANAALRNACDAGQIVTREELDRAVGDRKKRDMAVSRNLRDSLKFVFGNHDGLVWHRIDDDYLESILPRVK